ncbi:MAG: uracil-DNA glycosylase family protein [Candidatus Micrarchaeia archaeon]
MQNEKGVCITYKNIRYKLSKNALIMFIGINPHHGSYRRHVPFSNNKMFWYLLSRSGIIDEPISTLRDDAKLREMYEKRFVQKYRLNFLNLVDRPTTDVSELRKGEGAYGIRRVLSAIKTYNPRVVCFVGKVTYETFSGVKSVHYGKQNDIFESKAYLCHFPIRGPAKTRIAELRRIMAIYQMKAFQKPQK